MFDKILHTIAKGVITVGVAVSSLFGTPTHDSSVPVTTPVQNVGATIPVVVAVFQTSLQSGITTTATSMTLVTGTDKAGNSLSGYTCFNIDEGTSVEEFVCGTASGTSVTAMIRGIDPVNGSLEVTALKKAHKRGASVKITNYPSLGIVSRVLNGTDTIPNPITYATGVGPVASSDLTDKEYVLSVVSGGSVSFEKVVVTGTAGETVAAGNLVYLKSSDNRWWKTDADTASTVENVILGIAQGSGTAGNTIGSGVLISGIDTNQSGLTASTVYYASNTAGALSSTVGTKTVGIGVALSTTSIQFVPRYNQQLTQDQINAMGGSVGVPSSTNKFVTQNNLSTGLADQSQTTQNGTVEVGEANSTTKKNLLSQSFTPTTTKIRGVTLYKSADTGTFTGTVTVSLQADSAGSPSGSNLASKTFTNAQWLGTTVGEVEFAYTSEYTSMTAGSLYWVVVTTSTSDTSNHPNLGTNTAGGYANGSAKYKNTTDSWVAISTIDLYFKTLEGTNTQAVVTNTSGKIESTFYDVTEMPTPAFYQEVPMGNATTANPYIIYGSTASTDGSVLFLFTSYTSEELIRFTRDSKTGMYTKTHTVDTTNISLSSNSGMFILGNYVYIFYDAGANVGCYRYDVATGANETVITIGTAITASSGPSQVAGWTDGRYMYIMSSDATTTVRVLSISGTTTTQVTTATAANTSLYQSRYMFDGTNVYQIYENTFGIYGIYKLTTVDGSTVSSATTYRVGNYSDESSSTYSFVGSSIDTTRMYLGRTYSVYGPTTNIASVLSLLPVTKP